MWYSRKDRREMFPKRKRSDYVGSHNSHKRSREGINHLPGADKDELDQKLVSAVDGMRDEFPDEAEDQGDHGTLGAGLLAGE